MKDHQNEQVNNWAFHFFSFFNPEKCVQWLIGIPEEIERESKLV